MAYLSLGAFNRYVTVTVSAGRLDEDDMEDEERYDLLTDLELTSEDRDWPSMGFGKSL